MYLQVCVSNLPFVTTPFTTYDTVIPVLSMAITIESLSILKTLNDKFGLFVFPQEKVFVSTVNIILIFLPFALLYLLSYFVLWIVATTNNLIVTAFNITFWPMGYEIYRMIAIFAGRICLTIFVDHILRFTVIQVTRAIEKVLAIEINR